MLEYVNVQRVHEFCVTTYMFVFVEVSLSASYYVLHAHRLSLTCVVDDVQS